MRALAASLANMAQLSGQPMAETAGQFRPVVQRKLCGLFPSQTQITERLWGKGAPSSERRTVVTIGSRSQAERPFSFVEFRSRMQITGLLSVKKAPFSEQPMVAAPGRPKQTRERCVFLKFRLPMPIPEPLWAMEA